MARLTRAESQARTRERLVDTAAELFLRDGYSATSLAKVAEEAGYSTGAIYSNFDSKGELGLAVLDRIQAEQLGLVRTIFDTGSTLPDKLDAFERWADEAMGSGWPRLALEFALEARQEPELVQELAERERSATDAIAAAIESQLAGLGMAGILPPRALARTMLSLSIGIALQHLIDPKVSARGLTSLLRAALARDDPTSP
jgi:AcrR family transcriptional regulator